MNKQKKVIMGLEAHYRMWCNKCPYYHNPEDEKDGLCDRNELFTDAIHLLKAVVPCEDCISREAVRNLEPRHDFPDQYQIGYLQALHHVLNLPAVAPEVQKIPRVVTASEIRLGAVLFVEIRNSQKCWYGEVVQLESGFNYLAVHFWGCNNESVITMTDYEKYWRCWTTRPNEAQREATKWDG